MYKQTFLPKSNNDLLFKSNIKLCNPLTYVSMQPFVLFSTPVLEIYPTDHSPCLTLHPLHNFSIYTLYALLCIDLI